MDLSPPSKPRNPVDAWISTILGITAVEVGANGARPTVISRAVFISIAAMYQAWSAFDDKAVGTFPNETMRRPPGERTPENKAIAIAYAAFRTLLNLYPQHEGLLRDEMRVRTLDPDFSTEDQSAAGYGIRSARLLIEARRRDGSNQYGDEAGSSTDPYADTIGYVPVNTVDVINDPDKWQPITFLFPSGAKAVSYLTPHWGKVAPFLLPSPESLRPSPPPKVGSAQMAEEVMQVVHENANLSIEKKAIVEYMRDGPRSTSQSGQWLTTARMVSNRDGYDMDKDMKMYFALAVVGLDAFIAAWEAKLYYNSSRPWTLVRHYYKDSHLMGWAGPGQGVKTVPTESWHPFSPANFVTPPFPGYVSGHSTVSSASARILEFITGSDRFGHVEAWKTGSLTEENYPCYMSQRVEGAPLPPFDISCDFSIHLDTFTSVAELAGISRIWGGFHIQADNVAGLEMGRRLANHHWPKLQKYFEGTA